MGRTAYLCLGFSLEFEWKPHVYRRNSYFIMQLQLVWYQYRAPHFYFSCYCSMVKSYPQSQSTLPAETNRSTISQIHGHTKPSFLADSVTCCILVMSFRVPLCSQWQYCRMWKAGTVKQSNWNCLCIRCYPALAGEVYLFCLKAWTRPSCRGCCTRFGPKQYSCSLRNPEVEDSSALRFWFHPAKKNNNNTTHTFVFFHFFIFGGYGYSWLGQKSIPMGQVHYQFSCNSVRKPMWQIIH